MNSHCTGIKELLNVLEKVGCSSPIKILDPDEKGDDLVIDTQSNLIALDPKTQ